MGENPDYLFVYGTLMRGAGHPMHRVVAQGGRFIGKGYLAGRLYQVHHYPGVVVSKYPQDKVFGELYALREPHITLAALDDYEGCGPDAPAPTEFARSVHRVWRHDGGPVEAWVYLYNRPVGAAPRILSGRYKSA